MSENKKEQPPRESESDITPLPPPATYDDIPTPKPGTVKKGAHERPKPKIAPPDKKEGPDLWDRTGDWFAKHGALPALGVITIVVFAIHAHIFNGEPAGDDLTFHFAESARLADCLAALDFDFWNPSANAGFASAYYYQVLPQLASALPAAIFGHHLFWFELSVVLPHVLAPACAYKGMRLLGATPWQSAIAAFCVAFMNGESRWGAGNAGTFNVGLYTQTWALCAFPLALGYGARWMSAGTHLASAIAWGAFVFLCHPFAGVTLGLAIFAAWAAQLVLLGTDQLLKTLAAPVKTRRWLATTLMGFALGAACGSAIGAVLGSADDHWLGVRWGAALGAGAGALGGTLLGVGVGAVSKGRWGWLDTIVGRWENPPERKLLPDLVRGSILAVALALTWLPVILPLLIDREGFGGFPHRVSDEVGPGFVGLFKWYLNGWILDFRKPNEGDRLIVLTLALPLVILVARGSYLRWLWAPALVFWVLLGLGPHIGKIGDDLFPPVRALGAMQIVMAMGIGAGAVSMGTFAYRIVEKWPGAYWIRTGLAAAAAALLVLVVVPGSLALGSRVRILEDGANNRREEMMLVNAMLVRLPQGRKMSGPGAENHWWNLLPYAYERVPTTLQMGGGGLQASPNYDFLWTQRDHVKTAWIYDAPYLVFMTSLGSKMPLGETIGKTPNYEIRKLPSPGLVSPVQVIGKLQPGYRHDEPGHKKALEWIKGDHPMKDEVLEYYGSPRGLGDAPSGRMLRAWRQDSPGDDADIVAEVEADKPTTFIVRESWHPRWHAYVDGNERPVRRVTPDFPAIDVPAGKHVIEMRFERPWWMHAAWLPWPLLSLAAWYVLRRRAKRAAAK